MGSSVLMYGNPRFTTQSMSSELFFTGSAEARNIAASGAGIHGSLGRSLSCCTNGHQGRDRCCARCVTSAVVISLRNHRRSGRVCREVVASWGNEIISLFRFGLLINLIPLATVQDFRCADQMARTRIPEDLACSHLRELQSTKCMLAAIT